MFDQIKCPLISIVSSLLLWNNFSTPVKAAFAHTSLSPLAQNEVKDSAAIKEVTDAGDIDSVNKLPFQGLWQIDYQETINVFGSDTFGNPKENTAEELTNIKELIESIVLRITNHDITWVDVLAEEQGVEAGLSIAFNSVEQGSEPNTWVFESYPDPKDKMLVMNFEVTLISQDSLQVSIKTAYVDEAFEKTVLLERL